MTGNLNMMMKFRDIQVAEDVGRKAELGWFDVEFTMYGCAYWDKLQDKLYYKVSTLPEDIYDFIERSAEVDIYPSNVLSLTKKCPVPAGMKEVIAREVKKDLAKTLRTLYPKPFFQLLDKIAASCTDNRAAEMLWQEAEELEGVFEEEKLRRFEHLVKYLYGCRKVERADYLKLLDWLQEERRSMDDDFVSKDIFEKTLYGLAYEEAGSVHYVENAQRAHIFEEQYALEQKGCFVTPIFAQTYWYNYEYRLPDVRKDFKKALKEALDETYREKIKRLKGSPIHLEGLADTAEMVGREYGPKPLETLLRYSRHWGISW